MKNLVGKIVVYASFCLVSALIGPTPALAQKINIAVSNPDMSFLSGGVAKFKGFFKEEGLDAELVQITANVSIAALASGNIDYNLILQSVVTGNLRGLPIKVAGILIERPNHVVVVNPKITRFADLKGKKIAVSSFGSATDILARLTVEHFKLNPNKDVQFVAAGGGSGRLAQLESGLVDAAVVAPPSDALQRSEARAAGVAQGEPVHSRRQEGRHRCSAALGSHVVGGRRTGLCFVCIQLQPQFASAAGCAGESKSGVGR